MLNYYTGYYWHKAGAEHKALSYLKKANASAIACFPNRLDDIAVLQYARKRLIRKMPARPYYLGSLWYDKRQYADAIACWGERSASLDDSPSLRFFHNLAIAAYNKQHNPEKVVKIILKRPMNWIAQMRGFLMEMDQLYKRKNYAPEFRLSNLGDTQSMLPETGMIPVP